MSRADRRGEAAQAQIDKVNSKKNARRKKRKKQAAARREKLRKQESHG